MYKTFASSRTRVTLAAERTIAAGGIHVYGIMVTDIGGAATRAQFLDVDDNILLDVGIPANGSFEVDIEWLADNGLKVKDPAGDDANVLVTVFHNNLSGTA